MSNAFMQLHDFAVNAGLLDQIPEFGRQLRETTEKFLALARNASDDDSAHRGEPLAIVLDGSDDAEARTDHPDPVSPGQISSSESMLAVTAPKAAETATAADEEPKTLYGGIIVSHEPVDQTDLLPSVSTSVVPDALTAPILSYETSVHPVSDDTSVPSGSASGYEGSDSLTPPPRRLELSVPDSYSSHETTFGRRYQRYAIECALAFVNMQYPPPHIISRCFGFCLLFESFDDIKRRLSRMAGFGAQQSLDNWQYPFFHLGGAGTHLDASAISTTQRIGNQGTQDVLKPTITAGFATGPFSAELNSIRDTELDKDMRIAMPGFGHEYFDCDEVEMYLYQRGVVIPPGADYIAAEIDASHFDNQGWDADPSSVAANFDLVSMENKLAAINGIMTSSSISPQPSSRSGPTSSDLSDLPAASWPLSDPTLSDESPRGAAPYPATTSAPGSSAANFISPTSDNDLSAFPALPSVGDNPLLFDTSPPVQSSRRQRVLVNVELLVRGRQLLQP
jgi:hypothetical protein